MGIPKNILFNPALAARRKANALTLEDHVLIAAASAVAVLFPDSKVDIGNRTSGVKPPELGVNLYGQTNRQMLADTNQYRFSVEITYIPADSADRAEINHALFLLLSLDRLDSDIGTFRLRDKASDTTDSLGHITGNITAAEQSVPTDEEAPVIQEADQIIRKAETEVIP
ncbi:DUF6838 family protein [Clostridium sp. KNHs216]|uniref:phage tail terminator family protein n=1 Tax=Clostridium sp. KNHs216 TaxID=1550235 RepID=UPI0011516D19|nr:hypothetical protein [Clostridium sp. KNHs216]TQI69003.1 hypothetical protein LY85_3752 [Clostridium sp. KNHs216]